MVFNLGIWVAVFIAALAALVKGSEWFLDAAEKIGLRIGLSSFVVGVLIVGFGTSLPELMSSIAAVMQGAPEIVVANVVGSNIANILVIIGVMTLLVKTLTVSKNLIDSELPMLAISTVIFLTVVYDGVVTSGESIFLIVAYFIYLFYTIYGGEGDESRRAFSLRSFVKPDKVFVLDILKLVVGATGLLVGAQYMVDSVIHISSMTGIPTGVISITAIAFGTSLPEVMVSARAALSGKTEVAIGNIFGSNAFNALMVVGLPGLFNATHRLTIDEKTFVYGIPAMALATLLFIISGISKNIYRWEGMMFLLFYVLFTLKLFLVV
jgi:cation:H+ antiporter